MVNFSWPWSRKAQTFSSQPTSFYSLAMALDSGLLTEGTSTREAALGVPAVLRGRNMICNISTLPLRLLDTNRKPVREPLFEQIDPQVPNIVTLAMTVEDLVFDAVGWWEVTARTPMGFPKSARHVDSRRVTINPPTGYQNPLPSGVDPASVVYVDGKPVSGRRMIRFDSPNPPLLVAARRAIRRAVLLEDAAAMYAEDPRPFDYFTPKDNAGSLDPAKVRTAIGAWIASRRKRATAFVPETLAYNTVQAPNPADLQLVQLQARASLDIANAIGVDPEDLGVSTTSRTYQNATDRRQDRVNDVLSTFMLAITDRLSMADVTRQGYRVVFDLDDYMRADPTTRWSTYKTAKELGVISAQEIREREDLPGDVPEDETPPAPPVVSTIDTANEPDDVGSTDPIPAENAREGSMQTFSDATKPVTLRLDDESATFAVDREHRVISGRAMLFGRPANNGSGTFTFAPGSIEWNRKSINRVKFLRDHDWGALLGAALSIKDTGEALDAKFKVARGPLGDQALAEAEDGALDGLSVGLDITEWDEPRPGHFTVTKAVLNEVSLTPRPAFDDARLTSVAASNTKGTPMPEQTPDAPAIDYDKLAAALAKVTAPAAPAPAPEPEKPAVVDPAARELPGEKFTRANVTKEASPYTFDRAGRFTAGEHDFSTDFGAMLRESDLDGKRTEAGKRVMGHIGSAFAVTSGNVDELNPSINRPDMYYNPPGSRTPLWDLINKGAPPNGVQPFTLPKFNSASGLVADHTEGVEPTSGSFTTTSQTITPSPVSGKVSVSREVIDMGGNPATSNLIWQRMVRSYEEAREAAAATFINSLTAATDVTIPAGSVDVALAKALKALITSLNFLPGYDWDGFAMEKDLYTRAAEATDTTGRSLFPTLSPSNADGTMAPAFERLNLSGLVGVPAPGLPTAAATANNSWLFDRSVVHGYSTAPQRFEFAGTAAATTEDPKGSYAPVAMVDIAIWGYKAFANIDIAGVRQVIYDDTIAAG